MRRIVISGASGFVGSELTKMFESSGYKVSKINRALLNDIDKLSELIDGSFAIINLAGASIIGRWSETYKKLLYSSRIDTTNSIVKAISKCQNKPKVFISTSAIGVYSNQRLHDEVDFEYSNNFLSSLVLDWESEALGAKALGVRVAIFRFGVVLGEGGALKKMLLPFKLGLGGVIGDGTQAFSFIHVEDLQRAYEFVLNNKEKSGIYNLVSPNPTTNKAFTKVLGKVLKRPTIIPVPKFILYLIFGEGAQILSDGQSVYPKKLIDAGFEFKYKDINAAIKNLLEK